jgi:hypothetical protein
VTQVMEHLPGKGEAISSNPRAARSAHHRGRGCSKPSSPEITLAGGESTSGHQRAPRPRTSDLRGCSLGWALTSPQGAGAGVLFQVQYWGWTE